MLLVGAPESKAWFLFLFLLKEESVKKNETEKVKVDEISN